MPCSFTREDYFLSFGLWCSVFVVYYYVVVVRFVDVRVTAITSFLVFYCIPRIIPAFVIVVNVCICICFSIYLFGYYILFLEILDCNQVIYSLHLQSQNLTYASHFKESQVRNVLLLFRFPATTTRRSSSERLLHFPADVPREVQQAQRPLP